MKKIGNWIVNHLKVVLAIVTFSITFVVIGVVMLNSFTSYQNYEKRYDANDLEKRSNLAASPKRIEFEDDFVSYKDDGSIKSKKSSYKNSVTAWAQDLEVSSTQEGIVPGTGIMDTYIDITEKGGKIALNLTLEEKSFVDIDFVISSTRESKDADGETVYGVKDILSNVGFIVNGEVMEDVLDLNNSDGQVEWHHLVMAGFALPAGNVNITISNNSGKAAFMPQVRNITVFTSAPVSIAQAQ